MTIVRVGMLLVLAALPLRAQCLDWTGDFEQRGLTLGPPGTPSVGALSTIVFDEGSGPRLVVGGQMRMAGWSEIVGCARLGRTGWAPMPADTGQAADALYAFERFDAGAGEELFAAVAANGGAPYSMRRWDGTAWVTILVTNDLVRALKAFDDGSGPAIYYAGDFTATVPVGTVGIGRWDGSIVSTVGSGLSGVVRALEVFDDGGGPALYAGGRFDVGGQLDQGLARWDGAAWVGLGAVSGGEIRALKAFDDGSGPSIHAGGDFTSVGGAFARGAARWNGAGWFTLGSGFTGTVRALEVFDAGGGPQLYAGGDFQLAGGLPARLVARWNGSSWSEVGGGLAGTGTVQPAVNSLCMYDDGRGPALYAVGSFAFAGGVLTRAIAKWDGIAWAPEAAGGSVSGTNFIPSDGGVQAMLQANLGQGPSLYIGGRFDTPTDYISRWDGQQHHVLGSSNTQPGNYVFALALYDTGSGPDLYVGGRFANIGSLNVNRIARWNGSTWSALGGGVDDDVRALAVFDDGTGPRLYAAGEFLEVDGVSRNRIARWNGTSWTGVGGGFNDSVLTLAVYDDGTGPALYAGGMFLLSGNVPANHIARYRFPAVGWESVGPGTNGVVRALAVHDDGQGPRLYVGGNFTTAGGMPTANVASFDGLFWTALPSGPDGAVWALASYDDGQGGGPSLYATGRFQNAGGVPAAFIAAWDGTTWRGLGPGLAATAGTNQGGRALAVFDDASAEHPALIVGGVFRSNHYLPYFSFQAERGNLAKWHDPCLGGPGNALPYCEGELHSGGCVGRIEASGTPSVSSSSPFLVRARDVIPGNDGFVLYGYQKSNLAFHGGRLCVKMPFQRLLPPATASASGPPPCAGVLSRDFNKRIQSGADPLLSVGQTVFAQWFQRDLMDPGGGGQTLTDGVRFVIQP